MVHAGSAAKPRKMFSKGASTPLCDEIPMMGDEVQGCVRAKRANIEAASERVKPRISYKVLGLLERRSATKRVQMTLCKRLFI